MDREDDGFPFGAGRACLDLVATVKSRLGAAPADRLSDAAAAGRWLERAGFTLDRSATEEDLEELRTLREAVFALLESTGSQAPGHAVACINHWVHEYRPASLRLGPGGVLDTTPIPVTPHAALSSLAVDAVDLLTGPDRDRVRRCDAVSCATYFLATGSGKPRRWCASGTCGNQARVNAYRARREGK